MNAERLLTRRMLNAVVIDLSPHPATFAVVIAGELLPMRFRTYVEAVQHARDLAGIGSILIVDQTMEDAA